MKSGHANLPLHYGHVPHWLGQRMTRLGRVITEAIVYHYGPDEMLKRLAHPFWFQAFGAVMGMDWHSSGITTSVMGALKRGIKPIEKEIGLYVCGGRGKHSKKTPQELLDVGFKTGIDGDHLSQTSRLVAKVDNVAVQDGFDLYLHSFIVSKQGHWTVVQQGMNTRVRQARRYHWHSQGLNSFIIEPHKAIDGHPLGEIINLTDKRAKGSQQIQLEMINDHPDRVIEMAKKIPWDQIPNVTLSSHHDVRSNNIDLKRLSKTISAVHERGPKDFEQLLLTQGFGARTLFSLAMVAEIVHGKPSRFSDPARFSLALGGKDGHPYPVPLKIYDETVSILKKAVGQAKLGQDDKIMALKKLDQKVNQIDKSAKHVCLGDFVGAELKNSGRYKGMTVFNKQTKTKTHWDKKKGQLDLFNAP